MGVAVPESQSLSHEIDAEGFKVVADRMVLEAGIEPMLHRTFVAPILDGNAVVGVITESKAGREAITARRVIDCSGDADVAHRAGAPTHLAPREQLMAASVMFHLAGVDKRRFLEGVAADPQTYADWAGNGEWDIETSGKEDAIKITPPIELTLEYGVEFIEDDELVEITPKSIRLRKRFLKEHDRKRAREDENDQRKQHPHRSLSRNQSPNLNRSLKTHSGAACRPSKILSKSK